MDGNAARILAVDDEPGVRAAMQRILSRAGLHVVTAGNVAEARAALQQNGPFDVLLTDINMPGLPGTALLADAACMAPNTVAVVVSGRGDIRTAVDAIQHGAVEYVEKPLSPQLLLDATRRALEHRDRAVEEHARRMAMEQRATNATGTLLEQTRLLVATQHALLRSMTRLTAFRDPETGRHLDRVAAYCQLIAQQLREDCAFDGAFNDTFITKLVLTAPLHDVGKVGIPDHILDKPGRLNPEEIAIMQTHTTLGREAILKAREDLPNGLDCSVLDMAADIAGSHHEHWDGTGYPQRIQGEAISLAARVVAVADYFDACTSPRIYRPQAIPNNEVFALMEEMSGTWFDPVVLAAFLSQRTKAQDLQNRLRD